MKRIILFGDSLFNGFRNHQNTNLITSGLQKRLPKTRIVNLSKNGATTVEGLDYLKLIAKNNDLIVIEYGTNDSTIWGITPELYDKNLHKIVKFCQPMKTIIVSPWQPCPTSPQVNNFINSNLVKNHQIAKSLAQEYHIPFVDLWQLTKTVKYPQKLYQTDGLHLSDLGNNKLLNLLTPIIKKELS